MISSMTGFVARNFENQKFSVRLEIKSVNHRYLEIQCRLPEEFRFLESLLRRQISQSVLRGKIECRLNIRTDTTNQNFAKINWELVDQLADLSKEISKKHPHLKKMSIAQVLTMGGLQENDSLHDDSIQSALNTLLQDALLAFREDRDREGLQLKNHLKERLSLMEDIINQLQSIFPQLIEQHIAKIRERLQEAIGNIDEDRIKQEFAIFVQKSDIDEEFSRLRTHIAEVQRIIEQKNPNGAGKRLDFLMQELNREANTLGSKAISIECTQASVELKVLIEQMREQVQNIE